jgi:protein-disulfide isomerase
MRSLLLFGGAIAGIFLLVPNAAPAQDLRGAVETIVKDYLASHPDEVGEIVKGYMLKHPEVISEVLSEALRTRPSIVASTSSTTPVSSNNVASRGAAVASNAKQLFSSPHQVSLGNPDADVTLVEFFDYSCGFCKRALPDMLALLNDDPKLKVVLKEFPILGTGSMEAARVAIAVRMQDPSGLKYLAFHRALLGEDGPVTREKALAAAKAQGVDMARLDADMASDEVAATLAENTKLGDAVGIHGTPGYVIGDDVVAGAIGAAALRTRIAAARGRTEK